MEIVTLGKTLEIAKEKMVTLMVGDIRFNITCTPDNLRELAIGFVVSEGLAAPGRICVRVEGDVIIVESANLQHRPSPTVVKVRSSGSPGLLVSTDKLPAVSVERNFTLEECRNALKYIETDWYKRTRGYHSAALVAKSGTISRAYDVGRHNAVDKAIGMGIERNVNCARVFLLVSGRISEGMVTKCARCGIPLLVSKAAILDSAIENAGK
ncbi:Sulfur carrier protein FdhD [subsurface metagenome]